MDDSLSSTPAPSLSETLGALCFVLFLGYIFHYMEYITPEGRKGLRMVGFFYLAPPFTDA